MGKGNKNYLYGNVSQESVQLRDLGIKFNKPRSPIERYLNDYRGLYRNTGLFSKTPGQTIVEKLIKHLKENG